jgi:hypothetical protein
MNFNKFFFSIAKKINHNIEPHSGKGNRTNNSKYYLSQLPNKPFTEIKFNNTSTSEIEIIMISLKIKCLMTVIKPLQKQ